MIRGDRPFPASYAVTQFFKFGLSVGVYPSSPSMVLEMEKKIERSIRHSAVQAQEITPMRRLSEINVGERKRLELTWTRAQEVTE